MPGWMCADHWATSAQDSYPSNRPTQAQAQYLKHWQGQGQTPNTRLPHNILPPASATADYIKTPDIAQPCQLLKPNWTPASSHSISTPANINTRFLLQCACACVCVCVRISI